MRRIVALAAAVILGLSEVHPDAAENKYGPGVSDTEIKLGQTMPYSGPLSALSAYGRTEVAYYKMINDEGGINGRKVTLISLDDGYKPPKTVEQTRKLVEQDGVLAIVSSLGTPTNTAIYKYLNERHVPQLFIASGASKWRDYKNSPWTLSATQNYVTEGHIYAKYILRNRPDAKIAVLYQNDDFGKDYLKGLKEGLGDHDKMIVAEASYETTDPTVDSQIIALKESGADTFIEFTLTKFTSLTIRKVYELGWKPQHFIPSVSNGIGAVLTPAGALERSIGIYSAQVLKSVSDPQWTNDPGFKDWLAFMRKYLPDADINDTNHEAGYNTAQLIAQALKQCGNDLTRENLMRQATNFNNFQPSMMLPGITVTTSPTNYDTFHSARLGRFDGTSWVLVGDLISD